MFWFLTEVTREQIDNGTRREEFWAQIAYKLYFSLIKILLDVLIHPFPFLGDMIFGDGFALIDPYM